jgi:methyl-accepting chemotaxis protein
MNLSIRARLMGLVGVFAIGLIAITSTLLYWQSQIQIDRRQEQLRELVDATIGIIAAQYAQAAAGTITQAEAQARARDIISKQRYAGDNYFWINDLHPRIVMHPIKPQLNGRDATAMKDPNGKALFVEFAKVARNSGSGFVDYMWPKPGFEKPVEKTSFVKLFAPWGWVVGTGVYNDDLAAERNRMVLTAAAIGGGILLLVLVLAVFTTRDFTRRFAALKGAMRELANGNFEVVLPGLGRKDEIGEMAGAIEAFKAKAAEKAQGEAQAKAEQDKGAAREREAMMTRVMTEFDAAVGGIVGAAMSGDFSQRVSLDGKDGVIRNLANNLNTMCDNIGRVLDDMVKMMAALASGDLTRRIAAEYSGTFAELKDSANATADRLAQVAADIDGAVVEVAGAAAEVATSTTDLSQRTEQQAAGLEQTSASMEEMAATVKKNAESAGHANNLTVGARSAAENGGQVVASAVEAMSRIAASSHKISDIIGVIDEIARQTNLLALNAAVEAARAGDAGRGFAVVASEVRSLAQRSSQAAKDIKDLITSSSGQVQEGVDLVNHAGKSLTEIVESIRSVADIVADIANASNEQAQGIDQVTKALTQMDEVTQQNSALVEENAATAKTLEQQASIMKERVAFFKLADAPRRHARPDTAAAPAAAMTAATRKPAPAAAAAAKTRKPAPAPSKPNTPKPAARSAARSQGVLAMKDDWTEF